MDIFDANGKPITDGSVLKHIKENDRGVVINVVKPGGKQIRHTGLECVGDIQIRTSPYTTRCTNKYGDWEHVSHQDQTYEERYLSWKSRPYIHDPELYHPNPSVGLAIDGIMSLLPDSIADFDYEDWPVSIEAALKYLTRHLSELKSK